MLIERPVLPGLSKNTLARQTGIWMRMRCDDLFNKRRMTTQVDQDVRNSFQVSGQASFFKTNEGTIIVLRNNQQLESLAFSSNISAETPTMTSSALFGSLQVYRPHSQLLLLRRDGITELVPLQVLGTICSTNARPTQCL